MKKKIEKKEVVLLSGIFLFFCIVLLFVPITGDDWYNYVVGHQGIGASIQNAITMYFTWEGRFISRILINLLTSHRLIYVVLTSLMITFLCYFLANFIQTKYKYFIYFVTIIFLLTLENTMWTQSFLWVAGSITYLFPTVLFTGYLYYYFHIIKRRTHLYWYHYLCSVLFSFLITMFVENLAACYIVFHFVVIFYQFYKTKKVNKYLLFNGISALCGFLLMLFSPGSAARMAVDAGQFQSFSLLSKVKFNIPNFVHYTFLCNNFFLFLLFIIFLLLIFKSFRGKWKTLLSGLMMFIFLPLLSVIFLHQMNISNVGWDFLFRHLYFLVSFILILIIFFIILLFKSVSREKAIRFILVIFIGVSNNLAMLISPAWGGRVALLTIFFLFYSFFYFILDFTKEKHILFPKFVFPLSIIISCFLILNTFIHYYQVYEFQCFREQEIRKQISSKSNVITIYTLPNNLVWGINPLDQFHLEYFKKYYHIPKNVKIVYQDYSF